MKKFVVMLRDKKEENSQKNYYINTYNIFGS